MILRQPFSRALVRLLGGAVDLYYVRGVPVARKWPSPPSVPPTANQLAARAAFGAVNAHIKSIPTPLRTLWRQTTMHPHSAWFDYVKRVAMPLQLAGNLRSPFQVASTQVVINFPFPNNTLRINWDPLEYPDLQPFNLYRKLVLSTERNQRWNFARWSSDRGRKIRKIYEPDWSGYAVQPPNFWNPIAGFAWYFIPAGNFFSLATLVDPDQAEPENQQHPLIRFAP